MTDATKEPTKQPTKDSIRELSAEQASALASRAQETLVVAAAGSGKTRLLIERLLAALGDDGEVVALTFTERAAEEMQQRASKRAQQLGVAKKRELQRRARLTTIDGFCLSLLYDYPLYAEWPGQRLLPPEDLGAFVRARLFESAQLQAARVLEPLVLEKVVLDACELLRLRDVDMTGLAREADALTVKMRERFRRELADACGQLACPAPLAGLVDAEAARLATEAAPALETLLGLLYRKKLSSDGSLARDTLRDLAEMAPALFAPPNPVHQAALREILALAARLVGEHQKWKRAHDAFDFADLERTALQLLAHPLCRADLQARIGHLLIDEVQDTNPLQEQLLEQLGADAQVFRVGDPRQAIYGFRDAEVESILSKRAALPDDACFALTVNHRSQGGILALANAFWSAVGEGDFAPMRSAREGEEQPATLHVVDKREGEAAMRTEARALVPIVSAAAARGAANEVAILCRTSAQAGEVFAALEAAGVPVFWRARRPLSELAETDDVIALLACIDAPDSDLALYAAMRSGPFGAQTAEVFALHDAAQGLPAISRLDDLGLSARGARGRAALRACLRQRHLPRVTLLTRFLSLTDTPLAPYAVLIARVAELDQLPMSLGEVVDRLRTGMVEHDRGDPAGAQLMTIHAAKGLEWRAVVVPFCGRTLNRQKGDPLLSAPSGGAALRGPWLPDGRTAALAWVDRDRRLAEEHRLFYVAVTRARDELHLVAMRGKKQVTGPPRAQTSIVNVFRAMWDFHYPEPVADSSLDSRRDSSLDSRRDSLLDSRPDSRPDSRRDSRPGSRPDSPPDLREHGLETVRASAALLVMRAP